MGRRKDPPELQAAKGFPGRRRRKVEQEIEQAAASAEAERATDLDPFPVPGLFTRAPVYWRRAVDLWMEQAKVLAVAGRRRPGYRGALTRFCMWTQYLEQAAEQLRKDCPKGQLTIKWQMGHGAEKILPHPSFRIIEAAEPILRALEGEFGFTPRADNDLTRVESFNAGQGQQLQLPLDRTGAAPIQVAESFEDPIGLMTATDSTPPGSIVN